MKWFFISGLCWFLLLISDSPVTDRNKSEVLRMLETKKRLTVACSPLRDKEFSPANIPLLPGTGKHSWLISTSKDSAQIYFNQGMNLYYSFHIIEALGSFLKAQQFDPENGMLYWAEALAYGPNINDFGYAANPGVFPALEKANKFQAGLIQMEKDLITVLNRRYATSISQEKLNQDYRDAMAALYKKYPGNPEITALYADALMLMHPWDLYEHDQSPKPWTGEIVAVLEKGLSNSPDHPGINHYYIHAVEASEDPGRAMSSAKKLGDISPSVSHIVHMPSHIYIRTGHYEEGVKVNDQSLVGYADYLKLYPSVASNAWLYQFHNIHMLAICAMMKGDYKTSSRQSVELVKVITPEYYSYPAPFRDYVYYMAATPVFTAIRFGKWNELKDIPEQPDSAVYLKILSSFGKGIANARTRNWQEADNNLATIARLMKADSSLKLKLGAFNSAYEGAEVAYAMLEGIIEEERGNYTKAIGSLKKAVILEENMIYNEPKDWLLPPLPYLGQILLKSRNFEEAEQVFLKDLKFNPNNCWSLKGLEMTYMARGNTSAAKRTRKALDTALKGTEMTLTGPVF